MLVTIFVDASFFHQTRAASYAVYAISQIDMVTHAGRFATPIRDSTFAEFAAIANAIHVVMGHPMSAGAMRLLIQTDCKSVVDWLNGQPCSHRYLPVLNSIMALAKAHDVELDVRHIKAHVGTGTPRNYCHDWCDRMSRKVGRAMHNERRTQGVVAFPQHKKQLVEKTVITVGKTWRERRADKKLLAQQNTEMNEEQLVKAMYEKAKTLKIVKALGTKL